MERALTVAEVAQRLAVHPKTVYRMLEGGSIRGVRAGRVWRIPPESLEEFLRGQRRPVKPLTAEEIADAEAGWAEYLAGKSKPIDQVIREQLNERPD